MGAIVLNELQQRRVPLERKLGYAALLFAYLQTVMGAVVRITGSGMGCGDHWPRCEGRWFPPLDRPDLMIEITHRYLALILSLLVLALASVVIQARRGVPATVRRFSLIAAALVVLAALLGAITVKVALAPAVVVTHMALALLLLATLAYVVLESGGLGAAREVADAAARPHGARTRRAAIAAAALAFCVLLFGGLTANVAGAAGSCVGFPHCRSVAIGGAPLAIQITHRVLAFLLFFHVIGLSITTRRRAEAPGVRNAALAAAVLVTVQLLVAAAMVELRFPPSLRVLHQAVGVLVWLGAFTLAALSSTRNPGGAVA